MIVSWNWLTQYVRLDMPVEVLAERLALAGLNHEGTGEVGYDLDKLAGRRLVVRRARKGETLQAINGKVYELDPEMLVIADAERPVGLAGVMGGLETEIGPETRNVLIEAARFDPMSVRRTARALGLHSPSSYRFERGRDPERTEW